MMKVKVELDFLLLPTANFYTVPFEVGAVCQSQAASPSSLEETFLMYSDSTEPDS